MRLDKAQIKASDIACHERCHRELEIFRPQRNGSHDTADGNAILTPREGMLLALIAARDPSKFLVKYHAGLFWQLSTGINTRQEQKGPKMPRYFFHVIDGKAAIDLVGLEFDSELQVRQEALRGAREMMGDADIDLWLGNAWVMSVADEDANVLFHLRFSIDEVARRPLIGLSSMQ